MSIFSNLLQQAKDLVTPPVQMGEPIRRDSVDTKEKQKSDDGEMNEDGFVCIGRSSFYQSESTPGTFGSPNNAMENPQPFYSQFPSQSDGQHNFSQSNINNGNPYPSTGQYEAVAFGGTVRRGQPQSNSIGIGDFVQNVPMVLHPSLRPYVHMYHNDSGRFGARKTCENIDWSQFDYDFDFERRVIVEMNQHSVD